MPDMDDNSKAAIFPVNEQPQKGEGPKPGIGLCLSGGGYRAMLFHVGTLWRLNELGYLPKLARISSVSGGSITSGVLGMNWSQLGFDPAGIAVNFDTQLTTPIRRLASTSIDVKAGLTGIFWRGTISEKVEKAYTKYLFGNRTLQDLPNEPRFVFNATNVQTGSLWRFSRPYMADYKVGLIPEPRVTLSKVVTASSAFPPVLSPAKLKLNPEDFDQETKDNLGKPPYTTGAVLSDGGVYDNLGLETVFKKYLTVLVSDAGGKVQPDPSPNEDWALHSKRILDLIDDQVRSLRKRVLIKSYVEKKRSGAYWGIRTDITGYELNDALPCPYAKTIELANVPTRLTKLDDVVQERLINWGYAVCDAAMRKYVDNTLTKPAGFPYPDSGIG